MSPHLCRDRECPNGRPIGSAVVADRLGWYGFRVTLANVGLGGLFLIGLIWMVRGVEQGARHYQRMRIAVARLDDATPEEPAWRG